MNIRTAIFRFKINTNIVSKHIDVEFITIKILCGVRIPKK